MSLIPPGPESVDAVISELRQTLVSLRIRLWAAHTTGMQAPVTEARAALASLDALLLFMEGGADGSTRGDRGGVDR